MNHSIKVSLFILVSVLLTSCDKEHTKDYYVQNELEQDILVKFSVSGERDSILIKIDSTRLIYSEIYYFGTVGVSDERDEDELSDLSIQLDAVEKRIDEQFWDYEELEKYQAKYSIVIDSTLIE